MKLIKNTIISFILILLFVQPVFAVEINTPGAKDSIFEHLNILRSDSFFRNQGFVWNESDYNQAPYDYISTK